MRIGKIGRSVDVIILKIHTPRLARKKSNYRNNIHRIGVFVYSKIDELTMKYIIQITRTACLMQQIIQEKSIKNTSIISIT